MVERLEGVAVQVVNDISPQFCVSVGFGGICCQRDPSVDIA